MSDEEWLRNLKAGDLVILSGHPLYHLDEVRTVARRTPSGRIIVQMNGESELEFEVSGDQRGKYQRYEQRRHLKPPTPERLEKIVRADYIRRLAGMRGEQLGKLTTDQLRRMAAILNEEVQP